MTQDLWIPMRLPDLNEIIALSKQGRGKYQPHAQKKKTIEAQIHHLIRFHKLRQMHRVRITCTWQEPTRRRNPDNLTAGQKYILDALVGAQILKNDGWNEIVELRHRWEVTNGPPGVQVTMEEV